MGTSHGPNLRTSREALPGLGAPGGVTVVDKVADVEGEAHHLRKIYVYPPGDAWTFMSMIANTLFEQSGIAFARPFNLCGPAIVLASSYWQGVLPLMRQSRVHLWSIVDREVTEKEWNGARVEGEGGGGNCACAGDDKF